jgi:hypothetical protein
MGAIQPIGQAQSLSQQVRGVGEEEGKEEPEPSLVAEAGGGQGAPVEAPVSDAVGAEVEVEEAMGGLRLEDPELPCDPEDEVLGEMGEGQSACEGKGSAGEVAEDGEVGEGLAAPAAAGEGGGTRYWGFLESGWAGRSIQELVGDKVGGVMTTTTHIPLALHSCLKPASTR